MAVSQAATAAPTPVLYGKRAKKKAISALVVVPGGGGKGVPGNLRELAGPED